MNEVTIDGRTTHAEEDVHRQLEAQLDLGPHYGRNLAALRDRLLTDVERPVHLIWLHSSDSRASLGPVFDAVIEALQEAQEQDANFGWVDRLTYELL